MKESTDEGLFFSAQAEVNRYLFFDDFNDINIFIEDKNKEYEYETVFKRMFKKDYHISSIIAAEGKSGVKKAFEEFGEYSHDNPKRVNIFIVDGDFDRYIYEEQMIKNPHFIYLNYYNIENYFIDKQATIKFAKGKLCLLDNKVIEMIKFDEWKRKIVEQSSKLFFLYCAIQSKMPSEPNVNRSEYLFIDCKTGFERENAYQDYYDRVIKKNPDITLEIEKVRDKYIEINGNDFFGIICGKFLMTSLYVYLKGICKVNFSKDELRWSLVSDFNLSSLEYLRERINMIVKVNNECNRSND